MAHERIKPEFLFDEEKIAQLKQIAPECFEDGKINFETLRQNLGDWAADEDGELEHYGLFWPGKKDARKLATIPPEGTLEPVYGDGLKSDGTPDSDGVNDSKNIFIEGENMEVLKILQKSYANKIKMIYIDPPYNTGNDFVYDDDFTEPLQEYLRRTGQVDEEGKPLSTNKRSDGRFHSKWLSMMYPRLRLARNLLKDDGVIFVSIDDNEVHNLRAIMNEVFGEENFIAQLCWQKRKGGGNDSTFIARDHEYVLVYTKSIDDNSKWRVPYETKYLKRYRESDSEGKYYWDTLSRDGLKSPIIYDIVCPDGTIIEKGKWQIAKETFQKKLEMGDVKFTKNEKGLYNVHHKVRQPKGRVFRSLITDVVNADASNDIEKLFGIKKVFDNPKPISLIKKLLLIGVEDDEIVLDFFAGSASTMESVLYLNHEFKKSLRCICIQIPVKIDENSESGKNALKLGYKTITEVAKSRIIKSILKNKYNSGFVTFNLTPSNYKKWNDVKEGNIQKLESELELFNSSPLRDDWNKNKLLTELMLLEGFPLDANQSNLKIGKNEIVKVESEMVPNTLLICLDDEIEESLIEELKLESSSIFICLDSAISNQNKLRLSDKGLIKSI